MDPSRADLPEFPLVEISQLDPATRVMTIRYRKPATDLAYRVESSSDLQSWTTDHFGAETFNSETGFWSRQSPVRNTEVKQFVRLVASS